jgi:hypothetical protein
MEFLILNESAKNKTTNPITLEVVFDLDISQIYLSVDCIKTATLTHLFIST